MFNYLCYIFKERQWEIYVLSSILIILSIWLYNKFWNIEGTWSKKNYIQILDYGTKYDYSKQEQCESRGEYVCRNFLNRIFGKPFKKVRNIYNPVTHQYLELDCYNDELKLAIEYQGAQHYKYCKFFHKNIESFRNQQYRDELKRIYCNQLGITLIEVPYTIKESQIENFLFKQLSDYQFI